MFSLMLFMFFFFVGMIAVMWYGQNKLEKQIHSLSEQNAQLNILLRAMESRIDRMMGESKNSSVNSAMDPLLHLSFGDSSLDSLPKDMGLNIAPDYSEPK